jgi:hypothetical protein
MAKKSKKKSSSSSSQQHNRAAVVSVESLATAAAVGTSLATAPVVGVTTVPVQSPQPQLNPFCIEPTRESTTATWQGDYNWRNGRRTTDYQDDYYYDDEEEEDEYTQQARGLLPTNGGDDDDEYWNASPNRRSATTTTGTRRASNHHSHLNDNSWRIRACVLCIVLPLIVWIAWGGSSSSSGAWKSSSSLELPHTPPKSPIPPTTLNAPLKRRPDSSQPQAPNVAPVQLPQQQLPASHSPLTLKDKPTTRQRRRFTGSPSHVASPSLTTTSTTSRSPRTAPPPPQQQLATSSHAQQRPTAVGVVVTAAPTKTLDSTSQNDIETDDENDDGDAASSSGSKQEDEDDDDDDDEEEEEDDLDAHDSPSPKSVTNRRIVLLGERHSGVEWWQTTLQSCFSDTTTIVAGLEPRRRGPYWFQTSVAATDRKDAAAAATTPLYRIPVRDGDVIVVAVRNPYHWVELMWQHPRYAPNHFNDDPQYPMPLRKFLAQPWSPNATTNDAATTTVRSGNDKCQLGFTQQQVAPCLSMPSLARLPLNDTVPVYELDENGRVFANILQLRAAKIRHWLDEINAAVLERNNDPNHRRSASPQRGVLLLPYESGLTNATLQALQTLVGQSSSCRVNDSAWALPPVISLLDDASLDAWRSKQVHVAKYKKYMSEHVNWHEEGRIGYYPESKEQH